MCYIQAYHSHAQASSREVGAVVCKTPFFSLNKASIHKCLSYTQRTQISTICCKSTTFPYDFLLPSWPLPFPHQSTRTLPVSKLQVKSTVSSLPPWVFLPPINSFPLPQSHAATQLLLHPHKSGTLFFLLGVPASGSIAELVSSKVTYLHAPFGAQYSTRRGLPATKSSFPCYLVGAVNPCPTHAWVHSQQKKSTTLGGSSAELSCLPPLMGESIELNVYGWLLLQLWAWCSLSAYFLFGSTSDGRVSCSLICKCIYGWE